MDEQIKNGVQLFKYLEELSLLNTNVRKSIKSLSSEEEKFDLEDESFLPKLDKIFLKNRNLESDESNDSLLSIERYEIEKPPELPKQLKRWIEFEQIGFTKPEPKKIIEETEKFDDNKKRTEEFEKLGGMSQISSTLRGWVAKNLDTGEYEKIETKTIKIYFEHYSEKLKPLYEEWLESKWKVWKKKNDKYNISNQAYRKFFRLSTKLKNEADKYDLLWGHDILTWKQNGTEIYHPTLFTPVDIEFDPARNKIFIKPNINSKSYFDIAFIKEVLNEDNVNNTNLKDIQDLAEEINKEISAGNFDIWKDETIHKCLQKLVRYISADGKSEYNNRDINLRITSQPISYNAHNLFLLKKSGKSWAEYAKKIQEDIEKNGTLTPFLRDLIGGDGKKTERRKGTDKDNSDDNRISDGKLYFPLPYNEEQKKIADQIEFNYGAVVQGPPGTGKTHTIANLISRFLAKGKKVLVTSQTGQALSVLKDKIPEEIRSMAVSQVAVSARNNDLQSVVSEINIKLSDTTKFTQRKEEEKELELQEIREKIAVKIKEFERKTLLDSREVIEIGADKFNPISAAKFCAEFENTEQFKILDNIKYDDELDISQRKINDYISALKNSNSDILGFVDLDKIPAIDTLPTESNLKRFFELKNNLSKEELQLSKLYLPSDEDLNKLDTLEEKINDYNAHNEKALKFKKHLRGIDLFAEDKFSESGFFDMSRQDSVFDIHASLEILRESLSSFNEPYEKELFRVLRNSNQKQRWKDILSEIEKLLNKYRDSDRALLNKKVNLTEGYGIDYIPALEIISRIEESMEDNKVKKGIRLFLDLGRGKFILCRKKFIKNIKIDGKEIYDNDDVKIIKAYFLKIEIVGSLKNTWEQAFRDMTHKKQLPSPFNIIKVDEFVDNITRIVNFDEDYSELKKNIQNYKLFNKVDICDLSFVKNAIIVFDNLISCFQSNKCKNFLNELAESFEKKNPHKKSTLLVSSIKSMDIDKILSIKKEIEELNVRKKLSEEYNSLYEEVFNNAVKKLKLSKNNHKEVIKFLQNIETGNLEGIKYFYKRIPDLLDKQNKYERIREVEDSLSIKLQKTINELKLKVKKGDDVEFDIVENWKWKRLISWLDTLHSGDPISKISEDLHRLKNKEMNLVKKLVEISAWMHLKNRVTPEQKGALISFALHMRNRGKGTGKHASKHLKHANESLEIARGAVPVWIMPVNTIHQLFPEPKVGMFDVVIFDEASQVDIRGLNIAYIGEKLLVVGDGEQVSPTILATQNRVDALIDLYIPEIPNRAHFSYISSLFDISKIKMTDTITLIEHFRSVEEIIGFSNFLSYKGQLVVLRDQLPKYRLEPVLETVFVENGYEESNVHVNEPEAKKIVGKLKEMLKEDKYKESNESGRARPITFGVISLLGKDQQKYITKLISEEISSDEIENRKIICGDSYTFQGDERDIIFLSMVKAPNLNDLESTIYSYSVHTRAYKQRINVAMSRAKNKMILFHSIPKNGLSNPDDLRKIILDWFYNNKTEVRKTSLQEIRERVDSEFEYDVAEIIHNAGYKVFSQYEVARYKIDLVIQGENARLAVECDGDQYHNNFETWQGDIERQQIIERAGWTFWRVTGSAFYKNRHKALESLWSKLKELGINPIN